jgi:hypothetical protein
LHSRLEKALGGHSQPIEWRTNSFSNFQQETAPGLFSKHNIRRHPSERPLFFTVSSEVPTNLRPKNLDAIPDSLLVAIGEVDGVSSAAGAERRASVKNSFPTIITLKQEQIAHALAALIWSVFQDLWLENPSD